MTVFGVEEAQAERKSKKKMSELIERIEFHEKKFSSYMIPLIETHIITTDLEKFLEFCFGQVWNRSIGGGKSRFDFHMKEISKSRAKRPKFDLLINHKYVDVYPKENLVVGREGGLHYVCQHSFDMFPSGEREKFYDYEGKDFPKVRIGKLYTLKGEEFDVYTHDILSGFMLHRQQIDNFRNRFSVWIKKRRTNKREKQ